MIWDMTGRDTQPDVDAAIFSLLFYIKSSAGCHSKSEVGELPESTGFVNLASFKPPGSATHELIAAENRCS